MSNINGMIRQKLLEIQSQLPPFVKIVKDEAVNFEEVLNTEISETSETGSSALDAIGSVKEKINYNGDFNELIEQAARKYNISTALIKSVIKAESNFNPNVVSSAGAMGLMQLMPGTASGLGVKDAFDPAQNIDGGVKYLRSMLDKFGGNIELALAAYNAGPGNVAKYGGIPPFDETQNYVRKIMGFLKNRTFE